jgi:putative toxin-antitoxin system antitoxin component (TIGR02293 family)
MKQRKRADKVVEEPTAVYGVASSAAGETVERIRAGLPMVEFVALQELLGIGAEELAQHLAISRSTLVRRRKGGRLDMQESDRLLRYARLYARAQTVLQNDAAARDWLKQPARALNFITPLTFAETETGAREVEALLGRIEHGVFS